MLVTDYLDQQFTDVMDYNFTAMVEKEFDEIAEGDKSWVDMIRKFYEKFHSTVDRALESQPVRSSQPHLLGTDPKSGKPVYVKIGRFGPVAQIGDADDAEKPRFASLRKRAVDRFDHARRGARPVYAAAYRRRVRGERGGDRHRPVRALCAARRQVRLVGQDRRSLYDRIGSCRIADPGQAREGRQGEGADPHLSRGRRIAGTERPLWPLYRLAGEKLPHPERVRACRTDARTVPRDHRKIKKNNGLLPTKSPASNRCGAFRLSARAEAMV